MLDGDGSGPAQNVAVMSTVAPEYAPPGGALIVAASAGPSDNRLADDVRAQLRTWFGAEVDGWQHLRSDRIPHALPAQTVPFIPKRRVRLDDGVYVCGDHRDTASIQGALYSGRRTAEQIIRSGLPSTR